MATFQLTLLHHSVSIPYGISTSLHRTCHFHGIRRSIEKFDSRLGSFAPTCFTLFVCRHTNADGKWSTLLWTRWLPI